MDIQPMTGEDAQMIADAIVNTPPEVIELRPSLGNLASCGARRRRAMRHR